MADRPSQNRSISRRSFLHMGVAGGSGAVLWIAASSASAATAKVPKGTVNYQSAPKGQARCGTCSFFKSPSSCQYVDGAISPTGWCMLYQPKG